MKELKKIQVVKKYERVIKNEKIEGTPYSCFCDIITEICGGNIQKTEKTGITLTEYLENINGLEDISTKVPAPKMYEGVAKVMVITKDELEKIQSGEVHVTDVLYYAEEPTFPLTENDIIVLWNNGSHKMADLNQNFIPLPFQLGYLNGSVDNERYNLDGLLKLLKGNKQVLNRDDLKITKIPYYNATIDRDKSIEFTYLPTFDEYQEIMKKSDSITRTWYIMDEIIGAKNFKKETKKEC